MSTRGRVNIPQSQLERKLAELERLKHQMTDMLRQLEQDYSGRPIERPGGWRHDPLGWMKRHRRGR